MLIALFLVLQLKLLSEQAKGLKKQYHQLLPNTSYFYFPVTSLVSVDIRPLLPNSFFPEKIGRLQMTLSAALVLILVRFQ